MWMNCHIHRLLTPTLTNDWRAAPRVRASFFAPTFCLPISALGSAIRKQTWPVHEARNGGAGTGKHAPEGATAKLTTTRRRP